MRLQRVRVDWATVQQRPNHWATREFPISTLFNKLYFFFFSSFRFTAKLKGRHRDFACTTCPSLGTHTHTHTHSRLHPLPWWYIYTVDEPILTHHCHPGPIVHIRVPPWFTLELMGFDISSCSLAWHWNIHGLTFRPNFFLIKSIMPKSMGWQAAAHRLNPAQPLYISVQPRMVFTDEHQQFIWW